MRSARKPPRSRKIPGVYIVEDKTVKPIKVAESKVQTKQGPQGAPGSVSHPGVQRKSHAGTRRFASQTVLANPEQEFYIQLSEAERFGIVKLTPDNGNRLVEKITTVQVTKEVIEEPIEVEVFRKQMTQDGLYKLWPMKPMQPGEYAVVQYTPGKTNMQVWDFAIQPAGKH